jgi:hypothetical protein
MNAFMSVSVVALFRTGWNVSHVVRFVISNTRAKFFLCPLLLLLLPGPAKASQAEGGILAEVAVLTIHVSDTNTHEGVFRFLTDVLKLPVEYYPEFVGGRRYAGVFAGNMFIEPCGPFSNMRYPTKDFRALFYGLNCVSDQLPADVLARLEGSRISYEKVSPQTFLIQEPAVADGIYFAIVGRGQDTPAKDNRASLRAALEATNSLGPGLDSIKEIWLGYTEPGQLRGWGRLLRKELNENNGVCQLSNEQAIRFVASDTRGVRAIVFKTRSLDRARSYFEQTKCFGRWVDGRVELDKAKTFGLTIYVSGD